VNLPDITKAQVLGIVGLVAAQAVAWGWIGHGTSAFIVSLAGLVYAPVLAIADAIIRHGRSRALAPTPAPPTPPSA
jgi:hypothetical protein